MNETVAKFAWDFPLGMTGLCLALAAGVLLIVLSYFFTLRKLRPFWRGVFLLLRLTAFGALMFCLCNPRIETTRRMVEKRPRSIAVFVDESGSMRKLNYWKRSRLQDALDFLERNELRNRQGIRFRFHRFSDSVRETAQPPAETAAGGGEGTLLFRTIIDQIPRLEAGGFDGAIYLTDGIDTSGTDPEEAFAALAGTGVRHIFVPVTTEQSAPPSLFLRKIEAPTLALDGTESQFTFMVQAVHPLSSSDIRLNLYRNRETAPFETFRIPSADGIHTVRQRIAVNGFGTEHYRAELLLDGRKVDAKTWTIHKDARRAPVNILVYNGALEYGNRFLKNLYLDDPATTIEIAFADRILAAAEGRKRIDFSSQTQLSGYDVIVLFNLNRSQITPEMERGLREYVSNGGGLFFITGNPTIAAEFAASPLEKLLPVRFTATPNRAKRYDVRAAAIVRLITNRNRRPTDFDAALQRNSEMKYKAHPLYDFQLTDTGRESPIFQRGTERNDKRLIVPRFEDFAWIESAKPGANVLACHLDEQKKKHILMAYQNFGRGRSMILATDPLWRWRLKLPSGDRSFELFWKNLFSWLARTGNSEPAWIIPNRILHAGTPVEFRLSTGRLNAGADEITCRLERDGEERPLPLERKAGGQTVSFRPEAGEYTIRAERWGKTIASATFSVAAAPASAPEEQMLTPDLETLEHFASLPNVELHPLTETLDPQEQFRPETLELSEESTLPLWHRLALFLLICLCFALELILRRAAEKLV